MSTTNTIRLHRVFRAPPAKLYKAFLDADAMCKWLPPHGFTATMHAFDGRVGGKFRMSFTNFGTGASHSFGGEYLELVPGEKLRYTDKFDDPNLPGMITVTVQLKAVLCGTDVQIEQAGVPAVIPPEMCYLGWQESLNQLATLVEPEIPNG
ncbi:MAG: SRPBCC family protein [Verrucomicrobia bacterium]|nr:SRPBCC family protein [Verrucomicrobiota bacterium]